MILDTQFYPPAELTGFVRADLDKFHANEQLDVFSDFLPNDYVRDINYEINEGGDLEDNVVGFRAYDAESPIGSIPGFTKAVGTIPPLSEKIRLGEYDGIRAHQHGDYQNQVERRAGRIARGIARRVALARSQALVEGKVKINENGVIYEIDFGRDPAHTATPGALWSISATADPIADLLDWKTLLLAKGYRPGTLLMAPEALSAALRTDAVIDATVGAAAQVTQATLAQFQSLLAEHGLPEAEVQEATIGSTPVLGGNKVLLLPSRAMAVEGLGRTLWGETAEARLTEWGLDLDAGEGPGIVAGVYRTQDPVASWVKGAGISIPVVASPNATLSAEVLA